MRHRIKKKTLHRDRDHRKSLVKTMSTNLVLHEEIVTTLTKAKYLRPYFEKLVTKAKKGGTEFNSIKYMRAHLTTKDAVRKMIDDLGPRFLDRKGGYTRIVKLGNRDGDNAPMARIELVERPKTKKTDTKKKPPEADVKEAESKPKKRGRPKKEDKK